MISYLIGKMKDSETLLTNTGVGYEVSLLHEITGKVELYIHTIMRESEIKLYGFTTKDEKELFLALIKINKVGPNMAMAILRSLGYSETLSALITKDATKLASAKGVGKQMASNIVNLVKLPLDLASTIPALPVGAKYDAIETLVALGFSSQEAHLAIKNSIDQLGEELDIVSEGAESLLVAQALRSMR